jgi:tetratricopeptide (TPR) repeat protein
MKTLLAILLSSWILCLSVRSQPAAMQAIVPVRLCQLTANAYLYKDRPVQLNATLLAIYFDTALIGLMLTDNQCEPVAASFAPASKAAAILEQFDSRGTRDVDVTVKGKLRDVEGKAQYGPFAILHYQLVIQSVAVNAPLAVQPPTDSSPAVAAYQRGVARYDEQDWDGALRELTAAIKYHPQYAAAYLKRGNMQMQQNNWDAAISDYNHAISRDPKEAIAWNNRGLAFQRKGELEQALRDYHRTIELNPNLPVAYNNRAGIKHDQGDFRGALLDYNLALLLDDELAVIYNNRAVTCKALGDLTGALRDYTKAIELRPRFALAYFNRSRVWRELGKAKEALEDFMRSQSLQEESAPVLAPLLETSLSVKDKP